MLHAFQLTAPLAFADIERLISTLSVLPGVRSIDAVPGSTEVQVQFDEHATSLQDIAGAAVRAGYPEAQRRRSSGSCCGGGCGG